MFLRSKNDLIWAQQILEQTTHEDPVIRSLFLWIRAYLYCAQKKWIECELLAQDSVLLDPLSALGLQVQGIAKSAQREFAPAHDFFGRATKLDGACEDVLCMYHRGVVRFYRAEYTWAIEDLLSVIDDTDYGYDARIFVGRSFMNQKNTQEAKDWFISGREKKWGVDWASDLWLARVALAEDEYEQAKGIYTTTYMSGVYGLELITDFLALTYFQRNQEGMQELATDIDKLVGTSPWNFLMVSRTFREIGQLDKAQAYLEKWRTFFSSLQDIRQYQTYTIEYKKEEERLLTQYAYYFLTNGQVMLFSGENYFSWLTLMSGGESREQIFEQIDGMSGYDENQLAFLRWLDALILSWVDVTWSGFQLLPEVTADDIPLIRSWFVLLRGDAKRALQILTEPEMQRYDPNDTRLLRLKRAVTTRLQQDELAARYLYQLKEHGALTWVQNILSQQALRKESFRAFTPWMQWMLPYFPVDHWWISSWKI